MRLRSLLQGANEKDKEEEEEEEKQCFITTFALCLVYLGNYEIAFSLGLQSHRRKAIQM